MASAAADALSAARENLRAVKAAKRAHVASQIEGILLKDLLESNGSAGLKSAEIARRCERDKSDQTVRRALEKMLARDVIKKSEDGFYTIVVGGATATSTRRPARHVGRRVVGR